MQTILIPTDGSKPARHAIKHVISMFKEGPKPAIHIINVKSDVTLLGDLTLIDLDFVLENQQKDSEKIIKNACKPLKDAGLRYETAILRGPIAPNIVKYARTHDCHSIVMGTKGMGALGNLVLGSTANQVVHLAKIPVTLVK
jgi:nucleotide-binding universal stress UspA family protein